MRKLASVVALVALLSLGVAPSPASAHGGWGGGHGGWGGGWGHAGWGWGHGWGWGRPWGWGWGWGWGWPGGWWAPGVAFGVGAAYGAATFGWAPYAGYPAFGAYAPPVVMDAPPEYVQRGPEPSYADPAPDSYTDPAPERPAQGYWYYCQSRRGYYPKVRTCPEQWVKVPPRS